MCLCRLFERFTHNSIADYGSARAQSVKEKKGKKTNSNSRGEGIAKDRRGCSAQISRDLQCDSIGSDESEEKIEGEGGGVGVMRGIFLDRTYREVRIRLGSRLASIGALDFRSRSFTNDNPEPRMLRRQPSAVRPPPPQLSSTQPHADPRRALSPGTALATLPPPSLRQPRPSASRFAGAARRR